MITYDYHIIKNGISNENANKYDLEDKDGMTLKSKLTLW